MTYNAWVVFSNNNELFLSRFLKRGFSHCWVIHNDGRYWIEIDPASNYLDIEILHHINLRMDYIGWLEKQPHVTAIVPVHLNRNVTKAPRLKLLTCVGVCKQFIGLHHAGIITPWQLYQYLKRGNK